MPKHVRRTLREIYDRMAAHFGPTHWWPGDSPFEIAAGAILTQNTAWTNVEKAIENLKRAKKLSPRAILECDDDVLHELLRPSGYFRVKAIRLRAFCKHLMARYDGDMATMALLGIAGIGPETADDILLYACEKPVFVIDAYTRRMLTRHGLAGDRAAYEELRAFFEHNLDTDLHVFKEYHGLIVYTGKDFCRRVPKCESCPLAPMLKRGQPKL